MSEENVALIRGMYESFSKGDVSAVLGQMHQHIEWREAENFIYADRNPYLGPQAVLARGYSIARAPDGSIIRSAAEVAANASLHLLLHRGALECRVEGRTLPTEEGA